MDTQRPQPTNYQISTTNPELIYQLSLPLIPNIGDVQARILLQHFGGAEAVFRAGLKELECLEGIGTVRARSIRAFRDFGTAEREVKFLQQQGIEPLFLTDARYPKRLLQCPDAPVLLFYRGTANLNAPKAVSIVGTRSHTQYGRQCTEALVEGLAAEGVLVVSGLAFGIDALAHKTALKCGLPTIGVVGHGLDTIYPPEHAGLARDMVEKGGGLLTEFFSGTRPDKHHFPLRNRIVAGLSDATIVIETGVKGGSMITAKLANDYNRDVFAIPGRTTDRCSSGCNHLIQYNKALLLHNADDLIQALGWKQQKPGKRQPQKELFVELSAEEQQIVALLREKDSLHIDEIHLRSGLSSSATAAAMLQLEISNVIACLPGKIYKLL